MTRSWELLVKRSMALWARTGSEKLANQSEVIDDEQVDGDEFAQLGFVGVVQAGVLEGFEHLLASDGQNGVAASAGDVA